MSTQTEPKTFTFKKSTEDVEGIGLSINVENGHIMLDFGQPIQVIGASMDNIKNMIFMLAQAAQYAEAEDIIPTKSMN